MSRIPIMALPHAKHRRFAFAMVVLGATSAWGCGDSSESNGSPALPTTPLAGTVAGKPFTAKVALAKKAVSSPEKRSVNIYDVDATCEKSPSVDRFLLVTPVWKVGAEQDLFNTAFYDFTRQPSLIGIADSSELEVVNAPTEAGGVGTIRVRARYDREGGDPDFVEGQIDVLICP